jgi:CBS domain containing-hemolysin-like protein
MFEGALLSFSRSKLEGAIQDPARRKAVLEKLDSRRDDFLLSIIILNAAANVVFILTVLRIFQPDTRGLGGFLVMLGVSLAVIIVVMELVPRSLGDRFAEKILASFLWAVEVSHMLVLPFAAVVKFISGVVQRAAGAEHEKNPADEAEVEIMDALKEGEREGVLKKGGKDMIEGIISLQDADVAAVMTPRTEMVSISVDATFDEAVKLINEQGHSRVPVHEKTRDRIVGVLFAKDLLKHIDGKGEPKPALRGVMRKAYFVPETKHISELLNEMRHEKKHMMIVLDEYGGTSGIITIEDIIEEIVGEIADEYDVDEASSVKTVSGGSLVAEARIPIRELNDRLGTALPEDDNYDTVAGFLTAEMGKIPAAGEYLVFMNIKFTVLEADERRVKKVKIEVIPDSPK